jgi:hypothetical protein
MIINVTIEIDNKTAVFTTQLDQLGYKMAKILPRMGFPDRPIKNIQISTNLK